MPTRHPGRRTNMGRRYFVTVKREPELPKEGRKWESGELMHHFSNEGSYT